MDEHINGRSGEIKAAELAHLLGIFMGQAIAHSPELRETLRHFAFRFLLTQEERESIFAWPHGIKEDEVYAATLKARGNSHEKVAEALDLGTKRVEQIFASLREKLGVGSTEEVVVRAERAGLLQSEPVSPSRNPTGK